MSIRKIHYALLAATLAILSPTEARADSTVILKPGGTAKKQNLNEVTTSISELVANVDGLILSENAAGAECIVEPACLASAGADDGVKSVVGVHVSGTGPTFRILLVAVDVSTRAELARQEITGVKGADLASMAGPGVLQFVAAIPEQEPATTAGEESAVEEPAVEAPAEEESAVAEPIETPADEGSDAAVGNASFAGESGTSSPVDTVLPYRVEIGLATGVFLPQLSSELGTAASLELDVGVPVWKSLAVVGAIGYSQPTVDSNLSDSRLADMMYSTDTTQRELTITAGATWRFLKASSKFNAYAGLGPRIWLLETVTNGKSGGVSFGENQETSTRIGGAAWGGAEYLLGPGAATAELDFGGSDLPHRVTGDVATTGLALQIGYRLRL